MDWVDYYPNDGPAGWDLYGSILLSKQSRWYSTYSLFSMALFRHLLDTWRSTFKLSIQGNGTSGYKNTVKVRNYLFALIRAFIFRGEDDQNRTDLYHALIFIYRGFSPR